MPRPKQHYLPASLIGSFSVDTRGRFRERFVWVRRRGAGSAVRSRAEQLASQHGLYTITGAVGKPPGPPSDIIDKMWAYENELPAAISTLASSGARQLGAETWLRVLVPFVASLFVRGPEFNRRFESRAPIRDIHASFGPAWLRDNTNFARLFEMQRFYFPVMCAEWTLAFCSGPGTLVTNDIGYTLLIDPASGQPAYVVPLSPVMTLKLNKGPSCLQMCWTGAEWVMEGFAQATLYPEGVTNLNSSMAVTAMREVYGSTESIVDGSTRAWNIDSHPPAEAPGPDYLAMDSRTMRDQEMAWFRMLSAVVGPPPSDGPTVFNMR